MTLHTYSAALAWTGSTGGGYRGYSRTHLATARPALAQLQLSADPEFRGNPEQLNPEQLLVLSASSCQLLSFLAVAARDGLDVLEYADEAAGFMDDRDPPARISRIVLRPTIRVGTGIDPERVHRLAEIAHEQCYIANSLTATVELDVTVVHR